MKQNLKKFGLLLVVVLFLPIVSLADAPSLESINAEIEKKFGPANYFVETMPGVGDFNYTILEKYRVPVYGGPHGGEKEVDSKTGRTEPRFLGYNEFGESVPNPEYPFDSSR